MYSVQTFIWPTFCYKGMVVSAILSATLLLAIPVMAQTTNVLTSHNDNFRSGQNTQETLLGPSTLNSYQFGKLFSQPVDGPIYAQPLYMGHLTMNGGVHNVVFVATEADSVYAFDADGNAGSNANPLWKASLIDALHGAGAGATPATMCSGLPQQPPCTSIGLQEGITSTPVIDSSSNTMYVVAKSQEAGIFVHRLHALDISSGNEKFGGPVQIHGSVLGSGDNNGSNVVTFKDIAQLNRPGLLLVNGTIYIAFASNGYDFSFCQYYGWLFAYDATTLSQKGILATTPNGIPFTPGQGNTCNGDLSKGGSGGAGGGIWMSGAGLAADTNGNLFVATGNGTFDPLNPQDFPVGNDFGDSILKIASVNGGLSVSDYFSPFNNLTQLNPNDWDLGSGGVLLLPDQPGAHPHVLVQAGKGGSADPGPAPLAPIHVIDRDQMTVNNQHFCNGCPSDTNILQELPAAVGGMWAMPAYWNNTVYFWGSNDTLKAFSLNNGLLSTTPIFQSSDTYHNAANLTISGSAALTQALTIAGNPAGRNGVVWAIQNDASPAILHAYNATTGAAIYSSTTRPDRDSLGTGQGSNPHFILATVANGKVYVGTTQLNVFGQADIAVCSPVFCLAQF